MVSEHASPLAVLGGVDAGGQNVFVDQLARAVARQGAEVVVHTRRDSPELPEWVAAGPGVQVHHVAAGPPRPLAKDYLLQHMPAFASELSPAWERWRPDIVHAHFWMSGLASLAAAGPRGLPVVQTFHALGVVKRRHQGERDTSPSTRLAEEERIIQQANRILATCSDEAFELVRLGASSGRINVIPSGVDLSLFRPGGPARPRRTGWFRVVVVSRLVERKGIGNLISALADVPRCELLVAGGPPLPELTTDPEAARFRALARRLGLSDRVHFLGGVARPQVPELIRSADVVACVPWYEPFGMVALEAAACGVPVLASAVGGLVDTVVDGGTGIHVPPRDPAAIARALKDLLAAPGRRRALGAQAASRARERYSWDSVAAATLAAYREAGAQETAGGLTAKAPG